MKRLSFIIPVYNGEKSLAKLIGSLLEQDIPEEDYEMLFVDDCSADSSVSIIERFSQHHSGIRIIQHKLNARLATTCNTGIEHSRGQFIWIVDQDDWIEPNCLNSLLRQAESQNLDLLLFNYRRVNLSDEIIDEPIVFSDTSVLNGKTFIDTYFSNSFDNYLLGYRWRALFSKAYLRNKGIRFIDGMMYDDTIFLIKAILFSESVSSLRKAFYYYRVNDNSITYSKQKKGSLIYEYAFKVGNEVSEFATTVSTISKEYADILNKRALMYYNSFVLDLLRTSKHERNSFYKQVNEHQDIRIRIHPSICFLGKLLLMPLLGPALASLLSIIYKFSHRHL